MRVLPRVTVTSRFIASFTRRSASSRIASFEIAVAFGFRIENPIYWKKVFVACPPDAF
jgi:hypothetical protein